VPGVAIELCGDDLLARQDRSRLVSADVAGQVDVEQVYLAIPGQHLAVRAIEHRGVIELAGRAGALVDRATQQVDAVLLRLGAEALGDRPGDRLGDLLVLLAWAEEVDVLR